MTEPGPAWRETETERGTLWFEAEWRGYALWLEFEPRAFAYRFGFAPPGGAPSGSALGHADDPEAAQAQALEAVARHAARAPGR